MTTLNDKHFNGRKARRIHFTDNEYIGGDDHDELELVLHFEDYAAYAEDWIVVLRHGVEISRWRCGALQGIEWKDDK